MKRILPWNALRNAYRKSPEKREKMGYLLILKNFHVIQAEIK